MSNTTDTSSAGELGDAGAVSASASEVEEIEESDVRMKRGKEKGRERAELDEREVVSGKEMDCGESKDDEGEWLIMDLCEDNGTSFVHQTSVGTPLSRFLLFARPLSHFLSSLFFACLLKLQNPY
jgi:hypothetical protein